MQDSTERFHKNSAIKSVLTFKNSPIRSGLTFALHQFIGVYGIPYTAPIVFSLGFKVLYLFVQNYPKRDFYSIVSETPYFPVQIGFALVLGWLLGRSLRHRSVLWVWVLPLAILCYAFITVPVPAAEQISIFARHFPGQARLAHFFGKGCRPEFHCLDQLLITMPFYSSLAYAAGAFLARRMAPSSYAIDSRLFLAVLSAGSIIILAIGIDLIISVQQTGWGKFYPLVLVTPVGLGAYLLYVASTVRRQAVRST
jgi:hypothetical protein